MMRTFVFLFLLFLCFSCKTRKEVDRYDDRIYKTYYRKDVKVRMEIYSSKGVKQYISYYWYSGKQDSSLVVDEKNDTVILRVEKHYEYDSVFMYDSTGVLKRAFYYDKGRYFRSVHYWPNGKRECVFDISHIDTLEKKVQQTPYEVIDLVPLYSGYMYCYDQSGRLIKEGPVKDSEPCCTWTYYLPGKVEQRDTIPSSRD